MNIANIKLQVPERYPGEEIYRDSRLVVHRIEGLKHRLFCQNLSLLGKLFIEHKTLHYDPSPFDFFLILEIDGSDLRPVGYFSKEKVSQLNYNLACIVTFPPHQRKGVGKFIISTRAFFCSFFVVACDPSSTSDTFFILCST